MGSDRRARGSGSVYTSKSDLPDVQDAVRDVQGVAHASVNWPDPRGPAKLEVTFEANADEAEVTRNVLAVLEATGGVDLTTLELAADRLDRPRGASAGVPETPAPMSSRPVFVGLTVDRGPLDTAIEVTLESGGKQAEGRAEGLTSQQQVMRTAATATLLALRQLVSDRVRLQLEWVEMIDGHAGRQSVVQVAVTTLTEVAEDVQIGSAFVRSDVRESTVRATLDAVNRRIGALLLVREELAR